MYSCLCSSPDCRVHGCAAARKRDVQSPNLTKIQLGQFVEPKLPPAVSLPHVFPSVADALKQPVKQGWECPRCRAILAPHVERCTCKAPA